MSLQYTKEVLGVQQIIRPKEWETFYTLYGQLHQDLLLLSYEEYTTEQQELVLRIMNSLNQKSYALIYIKRFQLSILQNLMSRSSAKKFIAFGQNWQNQLGIEPPFHKIFKYSISPSMKFRGIITYCLSEFLSSHSTVRHKKLTAFSQMKLI
ncbi:MAG: hypothetical protein OXK80_04120 [Bdellovibrionales bacterium]|nr:hypothetical protein [Bdellovibrionales bacterium]